MASYQKFLKILGCQRADKRRIGNTVFSFSPALSCLGSVEFLTGRKRNVFVTAKNQFVAMRLRKLVSE